MHYYIITRLSMNSLYQNLSKTDYIFLRIYKPSKHTLLIITNHLIPIQLYSYITTLSITFNYNISKHLFTIIHIFNYYLYDILKVYTKLPFHQMIPKNTFTIFFYTKLLYIYIFHIINLCALNRI